MISGTSQNFQSGVLNFSGKVLVDFGASWCGPCQMLNPIIEELSQEKTDVKFVQVDVDQQPNLASQYNVSSIPTVLIFDHGKLTNTLVGYHQKPDYLQALI